MSFIKERLAAIHNKIEKACMAAGRPPETVRLVLVSKTRPAEEIMEAVTAGHMLYGENYVQELLSKVGSVQEPVEWHFIGHLQSNKVKGLPGQVKMIHTVDRLSLAVEINRQWGEKTGGPCDILLQVNISGEGTKSGTTSDASIGLLKEMASLPYLRIRGLMTMPPFFDNPEEARPYFRQLRQLSERIVAEEIPGVEMRELSMGMSGDFEVAIEEGATLVRIGTAVFGER